MLCANVYIEAIFGNLARTLCTRTVTLDELRCILDIQVESASYRVCAFRKLKKNGYMLIM